MPSCQFVQLYLGGNLVVVNRLRIEFMLIRVVKGTAKQERAATNCTTHTEIWIMSAVHAGMNTKELSRNFYEIVTVYPKQLSSDTSNRLRDATDKPGSPTSQPTIEVAPEVNEAGNRRSRHFRRVSDPVSRHFLPDLCE